MVRMKDVAEKAGVSPTTVSHVVNGTRAVSLPTMQKVRAAMEEVGYQPDAVAQSLRRKESLTIGVIVTDISNPFYSEIVRGIEDTAHDHGYSVIQGSSDEDPRRQDNYLRILSSKRVDGLIIVPTATDSTVLLALHRRGIPMVFVDRSPLGLTGPLVGINNTDAAEQAVSHLIEDGHTRIGTVTGLSKLSTSSERLAGYHRTLAKYALEADERLIKVSDPRVEGGRISTHELLELADPPTAVFTTNNLMTLGALLALKEAQKRCPQELAVVGFDDPNWAEVLDPPLTVVRQPTRTIGTKATELLVARLRQGATHDMHIPLAAELVVRGSCSESCAAAFVNKRRKPMTR